MGSAMIETYFLFGGRLGRLQYFLAGLVINLVGGGALVMGIMTMAGGGDTPILALLVVSGLLFLWIALSMQAARIRDIGLSPLFTIVGFAIVYGIVHALKTATSGTDLGSLLSALTIGLQIVVSLFLLLMPGDSFSASDPTSPIDSGERLDRRSTVVRGETMARANPAAAPMAQGYAKPTFGRRGM